METDENKLEIDYKAQAAEIEVRKDVSQKRKAMADISQPILKKAGYYSLKHVF